MGKNRPGHSGGVHTFRPLMQPSAPEQAPDHAEALLGKRQAPGPYR